MVLYVFLFIITINLLSCGKRRKVSSPDEVILSDQESESSQNNFVSSSDDLHPRTKVRKEQSDQEEAERMSPNIGEFSGGINPDRHIQSETSDLSVSSSENSDVLIKPEDNPTEQIIIENTFKSNLMLWKQFMDLSKYNPKQLIESLREYVNIFGTTGFHIHCFMFSRKFSINDWRSRFNTIFNRLIEMSSDPIPINQLSEPIVIIFEGSPITFNKYRAIHFLRYLMMSDGPLFQRILSCHCPTYLSVEVLQVFPTDGSVKMLHNFCSERFDDNDCQKIETIASQNLNTARIIMESSSEEYMKDFIIRPVELFIYGMSFSFLQTGMQKVTDFIRELNMKYMMRSKVIRQILNHDKIIEQYDSHRREVLNTKNQALSNVPISDDSNSPGSYSGNQIQLNSENFDEK